MALLQKEDLNMDILSAAIFWFQQSLSHNEEQGIFERGKIKIIPGKIWK